MKILYHFPNPDTVYAQRTISEGFKNAFIKLGHQFKYLTYNDDFWNLIENYKPNLFITCSHPLFTKQYDIFKFNKYRKDNNIKVLTKVGFWEFTEKALGINEEKPLSQRKETRNLIEKGLLGDVFFNQIESWDQRMRNFTKDTGKKFFTVPLAADSNYIDDIAYEDRFKSDLSYLGTNLPHKRDSFENYLFPLKKQYDLRLYGQDWYKTDVVKGWISRFGQYFNLPFMKNFYKPSLDIKDEFNIYRSSTISLNLHSNHQKKYGGDCNERTFKIPLAGGFEIVDNVKVISQYFKKGKELIICNNVDEWRENVDYYIKNPEKRLEIIEAGRNNVLKYHTYLNRAQLILETAKNIK